MFCAVVLKKYSSDFCQTNYLNVYRIDLHEICMIGRTLAVDNDLPTSNTHLVVCMTFARAAPPAYDKKDNCCAGRKQTNYLTRWTQANQITDQLTITSRRRGG